MGFSNTHRANGMSREKTSYKERPSPPSIWPLSTRRRHHGVTHQGPEGGAAGLMVRGHGGIPRIHVHPLLALAFQLDNRSSGWNLA
jgi:hypothetical protein